MIVDPGVGLDPFLIGAWVSNCYSVPDENPSESVAETATDVPAVEETGNPEVEIEVQGDGTEVTESAEPIAAPAQPEASKKPVSAELAELTRRTAIATRIEKRAQEREAEVSRREREAAEREKAFQETDELGLLQQVAKAKGVDFNTILRRAIQRHANNGELAPEEAIKVKEETRDRELAELKAWKQEQEELRTREARDRQVQSWQSQVVGTARQSHDALPFLADLDDGTIADRAAQVAGAYYRKTGELPENTELLEFLENQERLAVERDSEFHYKRLERLGKISGASAPSTGPGNPKTSEQAAGTAKAVSKTLTNNGAAQRAASTNGHSLSDRDRIAWAAQLLD